MIASIIYYTQTRYIRWAYRNAEHFAIAEEVWMSFLRSDGLRLARESYEHECSQQQRAPFECPEGVSLLELWRSTLEHACYAWLYVLGTSADEEDIANVWDAVCLLLKGTFYLANDVPLKIMAAQLPHEFVLHAAVAALPLCRPKDDAESDLHLRRVFASVTESWGDQTGQAGPVLGRFPLHLAAANKCKVATTDLPSKIDSPRGAKSLNVEMFNKIAKASPATAANTKDSQGNYPIHMAFKSGYSWMRGLDDLFHAAPQVISSCPETNPFVLMAQAVQTNEVTPKKKKKTNLKRSARKVLRKLAHKKSSKKARENEEQLDRLNTVFELFQTDPSIIALLVR